MSFAVGEIVGHRYWVVSWEGNLFGPHSWCHWHPEEAMSGGNVNRSGHVGVYALKTKDLVEGFVANVSARRELAKTWRSPPPPPTAGSTTAGALPTCANSALGGNIGQE